MAIIITFLIALGPLMAREALRRPSISNRISVWWYGAEYLGEGGVIRQTTPSDCGVASLQMVFGHKGINAPASQIREAAGTTINGTSMYGLKNAARQYGLDASVWRLSADDILQAPMPLIAVIDKSHFVVVSVVTENNDLIVLDPMAGKLKYGALSFKKRWHGEVILFSDFKVSR